MPAFNVPGNADYSEDLPLDVVVQSTSNSPAGRTLIYDKDGYPVFVLTSSEEFVRATDPDGTAVLVLAANAVYARTEPTPLTLILERT